MYRYHTPSGDKSTDGLAMALRAGLCPCATWRWCSSTPPGCTRARHPRPPAPSSRRGCAAPAATCCAPTARVSWATTICAASAPPATSSAAPWPRRFAGATPCCGRLFLSMAHLDPAMVRRDFRGMVDRCAESRFQPRQRLATTAHHLTGRGGRRPQRHRGRRGHRRRAATGRRHGANAGGNGMRIDGEFDAGGYSIAATVPARHRPSPTRRRSRRR